MRAFEPVDDAPLRILCGSMLATAARVAQLSSLLREDPDPPSLVAKIPIHHLWCLSRLGFKLPHEFTVYLSAVTEGLGTWCRIARYGACLPLPSVSSREGGG